ncbi:hypothetical protein C4559_03385 [Candidatus Microgenomates bacterium]|nr:MAG: hypothetical protein C4559_03385 [Candidatus Microgenomates bacterium]
MKKRVLLISIFFIVYIVYFAVATEFSFKPKWALDYFNPLANSLLNFRLDIQNPLITYDLSFFQGKWFTPWGILPSLILIPLQLIKGHFIPLLYLSVFFASLNTVFVYLILKRLKTEFFPRLSLVNIFFLLVLFAFGTANFYVGTLGSTWHVDQIVTSFLITLGIYVIFKKNRKIKDYLISAIIFSITLLGRPTGIMLLTLPLCLYLADNLPLQKLLSKKLHFLKNIFFIFGLPFLFFTVLFFLYNYVRFKNPIEFGFSHIHESAYLAQIRQINGAFSIKNILSNTWFMIFEIPTITFTDKFNFIFNLKGNSIFFLTPPFLAIFLASPIKKITGRIVFDPYVLSLWVSIIATIVPSLTHYGSGWMQFGYRYTLDITVLLIILSIFGMKGKLNVLYILGIIFSIILYFWGINILM